MKEITVEEYKALLRKESGAKPGKRWLVTAPPEERTVNGIVFASKAQAKRYFELLVLHGAGEVLWIALEPRFELLGVTYRPDFMYQTRTGEIILEEVEGKQTVKGKAQRRTRNLKQMRQRWGLTVNLVKR